MQKSYRLRAGNKLWAALCMLVSGALAVFSLLLYLNDPDYKTSVFLVGEAIWLGFFGLALFLLLSTRWSWLERDQHTLVCHGLRAAQRFDLKNAKVAWELFPRGGRILLAVDGRQTSVVLDNYAVEDRAELINWVVETVPGARAARGWEAFRKKNASWFPASPVEPESAAEGTKNR